KPGTVMFRAGMTFEDTTRGSRPEAACAVPTLGSMLASPWSFRTPTCRRSPRFRSRKVVDVLAVPTPGFTAPAGMADAAVRARATPEAAKTTLRVRFMIRVSPSYRAGLLVTVGTGLLLFEDRMTASKV